MTAGSAHASGVLGDLLSYWWVILFCAGAVLGWLGEMFDVGLSELARWSKTRHKRRMELRRIELEIEQAKAGPIPAPGARPVPGPCVHRNVKPVISAADELVAWLCQCGAQLPADWAVREEDL